MRELVLKRIATLGSVELEEEFDISPDEVLALNDEDLLELYDEIFGFNG